MYKIFLPLCFLLSGCLPTGSYEKTQMQGEWFDSANNSKPEEVSKKYCYKSLGQTVCYSN
jgi:hypothetical protein